MSFMKSGFIVSVDQNTKTGTIFGLYPEIDYSFDIGDMTDAEFAQLKPSVMVTFVRHGNSYNAAATDIQVVRQQTRKAV